MNRTERRRNNRESKVADPITVLAASNSPWAPTGYGTQIRQLTTRMHRDGHNVAIASNYGLEATQTEFEEIPILPRGYDSYSNDVIGAYFQDWSRQHNESARKYVLTLYDVWVFLGHPSWENIPAISWVPIDHSPIPPKVAQWCARDLVTPVAMSKYGSSALTRMDIEHVFIPHAIETQLFKPTKYVDDSSGSQRTGREIMNVPEGAHVTGIINANKGTNPVRKAFAEQLLAWSIFAADKPDAYLYLHTEKFGAMAGIAIDPILESVGAPLEQVKWVNQYQMRIGIPDSAMAAIYTGLDVLLAATMGEGFGLTVAEAAACETPAIVSDFSAQPELVVDGWKVGGQPYWNPAQQSWLTIPNVSEMVAALNESYERRGIRSEASRKHILANYDADTVYENGWRPFFELLP